MDDKQRSKRINKLIINLVAIAASIFVFSYAWFVYDKQNDLEAVVVGVAKTNNVEISKDGNTWGDGLTFDFGENFIFNNEVTSNGITFHKVVSKNNDGSPKLFTDAVAQKDYIFFDLWFKNDRTISMYLDSESTVEPTSRVYIINPGDTTHSVSDIERKSSYGDYSADLIAASVRLAFYRYNYNAETEEYELEDTPALVWAPNKNIEMVSTNGGYSVNMSSTNPQNYKYLKVTNPTTYYEDDVDNLRDTINTSYHDKNAHGEPLLARIDTEDGVEAIAGIKVFMWIEGNDRDTVNALRGGKFNFTLTFAGLQKEINNNIPDVTVNESSIDGMETGMQYSIDSGIIWTDYTGQELEFIGGTTVLVRYSETEDSFASEPTELYFEVEDE